MVYDHKVDRREVKAVSIFLTFKTVYIHSCEKKQEVLEVPRPLIPFRDWLVPQAAARLDEKTRKELRTIYRDLVNMNYQWANAYNAASASDYEIYYERYVEESESSDHESTTTHTSTITLEREAINFEFDVTDAEDE